MLLTGARHWQSRANVTKIKAVSEHSARDELWFGSAKIGPPFCREFVMIAEIYLKLK